MYLRQRACVVGVYNAPLTPQKGKSSAKRTWATKLYRSRLEGLFVHNIYMSAWRSGGNAECLGIT